MGEDVIDDAVDKSMDLEAETSKASFSTRSVPEGGPPRPGTAISEPLTDLEILTREIHPGGKTEE